MSLARCKFPGGSSHGSFSQFSTGCYANAELPLAEKRILILSSVFQTINRSVLLNLRVIGDYPEFTEVTR